MTDKAKAVEVKPKTEQDLVKDFVKDYEALCDKHQLRIVTNPAFKMSQDNGDWRIVLQTSVGRLPQQK